MKYLAIEGVEAMEYPSAQRWEINVILHEVMNEDTTNNTKAVTVVAKSSRCVQFCRNLTGWNANQLDIPNSINKFVK